MNIIDRLNSEFLNQDPDSVKHTGVSADIEHYIDMARNYARMENSIAVLSDLHSNRSHICYGGFADVLGISHPQHDEDSIDSIWEKEILNRIHPTDLHNKYLQELRFFHFAKRLPREQLQDFHLINKLRMRDSLGYNIPAIHRLFYISDPQNNTLWLTLCLYNRMIVDLPKPYMIVNSATGQIIESEEQNRIRILSDRETEVLRLIDQGMTSKRIAATLSISVNTVSRHRQEILSNLHVKNSIEACRIARDLGLI